MVKKYKKRENDGNYSNFNSKKSSSLSIGKSDKFLSSVNSSESQKSLYSEESQKALYSEYETVPLFIYLTIFIKNNVSFFTSSAVLFVIPAVSVFSGVFLNKRPFRLPAQNHGLFAALPISPFYSCDSPEQSASESNSNQTILISEKQNGRKVNQEAPKITKPPPILELSGTSSKDSDKVFLPSRKGNPAARRRFVATSRKPREMRTASKVASNFKVPLRVRPFHGTAPSVRLFAARNKNTSNPCLMTVKMLNDNQYQGCEILTLNGLQDPNHILNLTARNNPRFINFKHDFLPSLTDRIFIRSLNGYYKRLHDLLTERDVLSTKPDQNGVTLSHLDHPVISKFDDGEPFMDVYRNESPPGYVTNLNKVTKQLYLFCSVLPYDASLGEFEKRVNLFQEYLPEIQKYYSGVAKG